MPQPLAPLLSLILAHPAGALPCLAVTGAGGKTSLIAELAELLAASGRSAIIAPSTHIFLPLSAAAPSHPDNPTRCDELFLRGDRPLDKLFDGLLSSLRSALRRDAPVRIALGEAAEQSPPGPKLRGLPPDEICRLKYLLEEAFRHEPRSAPPSPELSLCPPVLLVEADGAARRPLKAHAAHEPVIPACANAVIAVMGLDALGRPLAEAVHRPELAAGYPGTDLAAPVTPALAAALLLHPGGPFRGTPTDAKRLVLLNKTDALADPAQLQALIAALRVPGGPDEILMRGLY